MTLTQTLLRNVSMAYSNREFQLENLNLDIQQMKNVVKDAISIYNSKRPHCSCEMLTPMQMHAQCDVRIKTYKENHNKVDLAVIP